jgi:hypothetical protein
MTGKPTKSSPLSELLSISDLDEGDLVLGTESLNKLLVWLLLAVLVQDTHVGLATVEGLGGLTETTGKTIVDEGVLENTLEGVLDRHLAFAGGGIGGNFNFLGGLDLRELFGGSC